MADHRDEARLALAPRDRFGGGKIVGERYLDLHMLACVEARDRLARVQLRGCRQDNRVHVGTRERLGQLGRDMRNAELLRDFLRGIPLVSDQRNHFDVVDLRQRFDVLDAERAGAGETDVHCSDPSDASARILENDVTDGGVRCRDVIETVHLAGIGFERAAHDEPHDERDAFGARLAHVLEMGQ